MVETNDTVLATLYCPNLLISDFTTLAVKKGENGVFTLRRHPNRRGRMARLELAPVDGLYLMEW